MRIRKLSLVYASFLNFLMVLSQEMILDSSQLIMNSSFEMNIGCPRTTGEINLCEAWYCPWIRESPDYWCVNCDSISNNILFDSLYPKEGKCFVTLVIRNGKYYSGQEHIQTKLKETLKAGNKYKLSFYVRAAEESHYFTDRFAVAFSNDSLSSFGAVKKKKYWMVEYKDALLIKKKNFFSKNYQWEKIELEYLAKGNEDFLTIGIFSNNLKGYKRESTFRTGRGDGSNLGFYDIDLVELNLIKK